MQLVMAGRPAIRLSTGLLLTLDDVHLRRAGTEIASATQVRVGLAWRSLLADELRVDRIELTQPVIRIARDREGRFNVEDPAAAASASTAQDFPDIAMTDGVVSFVDQRFGKGFEARDCRGEVHRLHHAGGDRADFLAALSFTAEVACAQIRKEDLTLQEVSFSAVAKNGVFDLKPLGARLFGTPGSGSLRADFSAAVPSYRLDYSLKQFPIEAFFTAASLKKLAAGRMDFSATLTTHGTSPKELRQALAGHVSLRGKDLTFIGSDLDAAFERFESSQTFSLVDVGAVFFAGPLGLLVTKGYDFASLAQGTGGSSEIRTLVSDWKVEHGVAHAQDVAMATTQNRIALQGGLDLANERFDEVWVALLDAKGCAIVRQRIRGSFQAPVVEKPNLIGALAGPALRLLKKGSELVFGDKQCEAFYTGSVAAPR